ncbi:hypothetical protein TNCV_1915081 [Trichonephila clavipes]|uniref:Uncharacterized protein n=1 Tax=Trichonephila clavipes TaxID=2585209 RepID=A0A8X7BBK4_TRICX|nr:hypothetical protein TNCV_1915081 [Trichonephila clavipes]
MEIPLRTAYSQAGRCGMQPKAKHSLRAQAHQNKSRTETVKTETLEKKLRIREREKENARGESTVRAIKKNEATIRKSVISGTKLSTKFASYTRDVLLERTERAIAIWIEE